MRKVRFFRSACIAALIGAMVMPAATAKAEVEFNLQGDIVSSYVWRGMRQSGAAFQPTLGLSADGFAVTAWGSVDFNGEGAKEADLSLSYTIDDFTITLTDYWWAGEGAYKYFQFDNHKTNHIIDLGVAYVLPIEKFPLRVAWSTMLWGADKKVNHKGKVKNAYSTYIELAYPFTVKTVDLTASMGMTPWKSEAIYSCKRFAVTDVSLKATKDIKVTDSFSIPVFVQTVWNPHQEDVHFVVGFTLKP